MNLLYLTILFPLLGFLFLSFSLGRLSDTTSAVIGVTSVGLAAMLTGYIGLDFLQSDQKVFHQVLWTWMHVDQFKVDVSLVLDGLSLTLLTIVTGVGCLIHLFSSWYMRGQEGYSRFFAYMNLFIASMVVLLLADNLVLMYLGWEGVGLCSYLLIGFYYTNPSYIRSAMKAFIITRVGDVFLAIALFMLYDEMNTFNIVNIMALAPLYSFSYAEHIFPWITLMLLGGAIGKSAQLPLQTWLTDAMVGPTPVSALIHAATMVTAGVYLISRTYVLFLLTPFVLHLVGIIGAMTLFLAGFAALTQTDIKRILAYSTMSQLGYMFLALGVQAWQSAIYHLMTHAFFKALLFLSAGSVILECNHEQNIFKMGGLRHRMPFVYLCFVVGGLALASFPFITSGFFSKEAILSGVVSHGDINLVLVGLVGTFITSLYTGRMIFLVFHGKENIIYASLQKTTAYRVPLIVLLILSTVMGSWILPPLQGVLPDNIPLLNSSTIALEIISSVLVVMGIVMSALLWLGKPAWRNIFSRSKIGRLLSFLLLSGWGFDWLYEKLFVQSYLRIAKILSPDPCSIVINGVGVLALAMNRGLIISENGYLRWYLAAILLGAVCILALTIVI
ncbi:NADH-quinone oxidoreductase subunit L [Candidatus Erwinia haradaeae]|uniref:NADH-quinone oxidoreductase subunit L n=1 Tax=Candidatus Erwinia haradaeae TaxID=1922217 RepID=A0A451DC09_9GAMM|nr:NADH-quinone oxidoreductase subunit L [Candidatus Erwinia haradaeae]VFP83957.1 NADH-quinone oxidoreductase subunit L [Candidatus Erwinia haradaeae]